MLVTEPMKADDVYIDEPQQAKPGQDVEGQKLRKRDPAIFLGRFLRLMLGWNSRQKLPNYKERNAKDYAVDLK